MKYIIEGIDRLGKSTLAAGLARTSLEETNIQASEIHLRKPTVNPINLALACGDESKALKYAQMLSYINFFERLHTNVPFDLIADRGHLGETIYAPLYRNYSGDYVFDMEEAVKDRDDIILILLATSNLDMLEDDGESIDYSKRGEEQKMFLDAFEKSKLKHKIMLNVHDIENGSMATYKPAEKILKQVLDFKRSIENGTK